MPPRVRRLLWWLVAGGALARLYVLAREQGPGRVAPVALEVTALALACWGVHVVVHELGHLVAARAVGFHVEALRVGPLRFGLVATEPRVAWAGFDLGGGLASSPPSLVGLGPKLRRVAAAGPLATLGLLSLTAVWYQAAGRPGLASTPGIALVMGGLALLTALLPSALLPRRPTAGSDLEQVLQSRRVLAHWAHVAIIHGADAGRRLSETAPPEALAPLLPEGDAVEPVVLAWVVSNLEQGRVDAVRPRLASALAHLEGVVEWLCTDLHNQAGALAALVDGDPVAAERHLAEVRRFQTLPWYGELLAACIAEARRDARGRDEALGRWEAAVAALPRGRFARSGNHWILAALAARGAPPAQEC